MDGLHNAFATGVSSCDIYLVDCGLQIWRMTDLLYRPEEEVLAELQHFKDHVIECTSKA